jgi:NADPH:quinone reductase-like Zn-dependent oxidoreductase
MIRAIEAGGIRPVIDSRFPLADIGAALRHRSTGHPFGKVCLEL